MDTLTRYIQKIWSVIVAYVRGIMCAIALSIINPYKNFYTHKIVSEIADYLKKRLEQVDKNCGKPLVGIVCGSGLGGIAEDIKILLSIPYEEIPNFPRATVPGHDKVLIFGYLKGAFVVCLKGRFHLYEGHAMDACIAPVRLMKLLGCSHVIITNAAGGLNPDFKVGDIMIIKDHINIMGMAGFGALKGEHDENWGNRFVPMNGAYDPALIEAAKKNAREMNIALQEGVYTAVGGPNYETVAELRCLRLMGVDSVGMSTVPEVIAARQLNLKVFGLSIITNKCAVDYSIAEDANHEEVLREGENKGPEIRALVASVVEHIQKTNKKSF